LAKLKLEKVTFISNSNSLSKIIERINAIQADQQNQAAKHNSKTPTATITKQSKPPRAVKVSPTAANSELFFIEYQFPIVANTVHATQSMRVVAKKQPRFASATSDDTVQFDHSADYSVLFNSQSLENWWRSSISFKVYCRSGNLAQTTPYLIGQARLSLRNALKSKNFKLVKRLAVYDTFNSQTMPSVENRKRIGTLHVSIELASDLHQFHTDLLKLKNYEQKFLRSKKLAQPSTRPSTPTTKQQSPAAPCNHKTSNELSADVSSLIVSTKAGVRRNREESEEEFSIPVNLYLIVNEGRGFSIDPDLPVNSTIYLICRLFWCKEKVKLNLLLLVLSSF